MISASSALLLLGGVLAVFAWVGLRSRRAAGDLEDYMVARNSQSSGVLGLSFLASGLGAWILFAPPEVGAFVGIVGVVGYAIGAAAPIVAFALLGPRIRSIVPSGHGLSEFVKLRYGRTFHLYVVALSVMYMWVFLVAELTAIGGVAGILSGLDARITVLMVAAVTLAYTAYGGLRASLRTDRWQSWILIALLAVSAGVVINQTTDPVDAIWDSGRMLIDRVGIEAAITLIIAITAANLFHQGYWQRVWAARDSAALRRGGLAGGLASIPVVLVVGVAGMLALGTGMNLGTPPVPFFALFAEHGALIVGIVLVLGIALVASSVDTLENGLASLVAVERPSLSLADARWVTVALMVPATAVAFQGYSVLRLLLIADLLCATAVVPVVMGLWSRTSAKGALAGSVAGLLGAVVPGLITADSAADGLLLATFPDAVPTLPPFLGAILASTAVSTLVSLRTRRVAELKSINERIPLLGRDAR